MCEATKYIAPRTLMPPYHVYPCFLNKSAHASLLAWTIENEAKFEPSLVEANNAHDSEQPDPFHRTSLRVRDFGPVKVMLGRRLLDLVPTLIADLGITPFEPTKAELELVANNDGAFFKRHIDTFMANGRKASDRMLSAVYYFHSEPKAFSGGALRLYSFGTMEDGNFVEVQPKQNTLVAFPSWAWHEVLQVSCPSRRFSDSRFNVNCWVHRHPTETPRTARRSS